MKKLKLARYGGLSPVKQTHYTTDYDNMSYHGAPEKYGIYSFLYPYIDWYLLSGTDKMKDDTEGIKKRDSVAPYKIFTVDGYIWTHIDPKEKAIDTRGSWYKIHSTDFEKLFNKEYADTIRKYWEFGRTYGCETKPYYTCKNPYKIFCTDYLEIFVPKGTKIS